MDNKVLTKEGLNKLKEELEYLKTEKRPQVSERIKSAKELGDLSENAEYHAAKESQGMLEAKISRLKNLLSNARVLDESILDTSKVLVLSKVKIKNVANKAEMTYTLVAPTESDLSKGKISVKSPIGKGLLGCSVGDIAEVKVPTGVMKFEIIEISR